MVLLDVLLSRLQYREKLYYKWKKSKQCIYNVTSLHGSLESSIFDSEGLDEAKGRYPLELGIVLQKTIKLIKDGAY